jgi:5-methylcytosine-specific restriction endonuclease McrA
MAVKISTRKQAANRLKRAAYARVCREVDARDGDRCRVCLRFVLSGRHHHHLVFRSQGGADTTANLITVCAGCHADIHERRIAVTGNANGPLTLRRTDDTTRDGAL